MNEYTNRLLSKEYGISENVIKLVSEAEAELEGRFKEIKFNRSLDENYQIISATINNSAAKNVSKKYKMVTRLICIDYKLFKIALKLFQKINGKRYE